MASKSMGHTHTNSLATIGLIWREPKCIRDVNAQYNCLQLFNWKPCLTFLHFPNFHLFFFFFFGWVAPIWGAGFLPAEPCHFPICSDYHMLVRILKQWQTVNTVNWTMNWPLPRMRISEKLGACRNVLNA